MSAFTEDMLKSMAKVEATRAQRLHASIERFTAEEKDELLKEFHPDYSSKGFKVLEVGPNKGQKVPVELAQLLEGKSRLQDVELDLEKVDYDVDVLVIGGGGAGASAALEAHNGGANVLVVTKLRMGDANTMMAEGGIQAADKGNDSPAQHYLDAFGGGHYKNIPELLEELVTNGPLAIDWLSKLGVMFDKEQDGTMVTTHGGGAVSVCMPAPITPVRRSCACCVTKCRTAVFRCWSFHPQSSCCLTRRVKLLVRCCGILMRRSTRLYVLNA